MFSRGYSDVRKRIEKNPHYTMSCYNCEYYYKTARDKTEVCQNKDVLKYDLVVTDTSIYCSKWKLTVRRNSVRSLFKKR